jgi:hypothetical protein
MGRKRGDYFPLSRFGDRMVIGRAAAADGRDVVSFHETAASADAEEARLKAAGVKKVVVTLQTKRDASKRASTGFMGSLHQMIDSSNADNGIKDSMHEALQQLYLKSLPELSGAKHMIRRENVEGFSQDALRVFADAVTRGARYASHLEYGPAIQAAMESAESQSQSSDKRTASIVIGRAEGKASVVKVVPIGTDRLNAVNSLTEAGYQVEFFNTIPESARERLAGALQGATTQQNDATVAQVEKVVGRTNEGVEDMRAAKALYNHMVGLQKTEADQDPSKIVEALGQVGYRRLAVTLPHSLPWHNVFGWFFLGALAVALPAFLLLGNTAALPTAGHQWLVLVWLGLAASGGGYFLWNRGAVKVNAGTLAIMNNALVPAGLLVNLVLWNREADLGRLALGGAIIGLSLWLNQRLYRGRKAAVA